MNNLNSVLIEGRVLASITFNDGSLMSIESKRNDHGIRITVIFEGKVARLFEAYKDTSTGRTIRIVGRIDSFGTDPVIYAEHFEWMPIGAHQKDKEVENHE